MYRHLLVIVAVFFCACGTVSYLPGKNAYRKLNLTDRAAADSMLAYALEHEALYSIRDTLKPISSVKMLRFKVVGSVLNQPALDSIEMYHRICRMISTPDLSFVLVPFAALDNSTRNMEVYVVNNRRIASVIDQHRLFFGKFGITPSTPPAAILSIVEYENRYDRWRAYGYLFGYPDHAVDFFVGAGKTDDCTHKFVERDFFQIPVAAAEKGYFTYAVPKGYQPQEIDSAIYRKAMQTLTNYKKEKTSRILTDNSVRNY